MDVGEVDTNSREWVNLFACPYSAGLPWWGWENVSLVISVLGLKRQACVLLLFSEADGFWNQNDLKIINDKEERCCAPGTWT